jgi:hypothetical protein
MRAPRARIATAGVIIVVGTVVASQAFAQQAHSIDWYVGHPKALQNALIQCNVSNGLIANQDCRNAIVAAHIVASKLPAPGGQASSQ